MIFRYSFMSDRKEEILIAAENLLKQHGAKRVTIDDICSSISIAKKTLYKHFANKHEVLVEYIKFSFESFVQQVKKETDGIFHPKEKIQKINELMLDAVLSYNPKVVNDLKEYYQESHEARIHATKMLENLVREIIIKGQMGNSFKKSINSDLISSLFLREIESLWQRMHHISKEELRKEQIEVFEMILQGIEVQETQ